ncbi:MAG: DUF502 domain-containing protein [Verrucomicrobiaceae bacterium]|nr:DUF502 domain-containing protein [Verrucomicrobiaceae bacterium]
MKRIAAFLKATTLGGLFVLMPVAVIVGIAVKTVVVAREAAQSIMERLTGQDSTVAQFPMIFAVLIVVAISFMMGLMMVSQFGRTCGTWIERTLLFRVPGYAAARAISRGFANVEHKGAVKPGLLSLQDGGECFVFITEELPGDRLVVFIPSSPSAASGNVQMVPGSVVRRLNVRITEVATVLQQWGVGSAKLLTKSAASVAMPATDGRSELLS